MRKFSKKEQEELQLEKVVCNQCGKELLVEDGMLKEGCFHSDYAFDYFSEKDGLVYSLDLCEACFDKWVQGFGEPVQVMEVKEYL